MLLATAVVATVCSWFLLPTIVAQRFAEQVRKQNYGLADAYFADSKDRFLVAWNDKHWRIKCEAELEAWTFGELVRGVRQVRLRVHYGDAGPMRALEWIVIAKRGGLLSPEPTYLSRFSGGMAI